MQLHKPNAQKLEKTIHENHVRGIEVKAEIAKLTELERKLEGANRRLRKTLLDMVNPPFVVMYDSTDVGTIPSDPHAVAGYVGGNWPTYLALVHRFPHAFHLSIAVTASEDGECLDIETGDATPWQAPFWVRRQQHKGVSRPALYANLSTMPAVQTALRTHGIGRNEVRLWVAHYTGVAAIPKGYDACQYDDKALGRNLDASLCHPSFFT